MKTQNKYSWMQVLRLGSAFLLVAAVSANALAQTGQVQWIHASADTSLAVVDVYLDGELLLDDFAYQTATPFESPIPGSHEVVIAPANSSGVADSIATFAVTLADDTDYHLIINGVADSEANRPNPDGRSTKLALFVLEGALQVSPDPDDFTTRVFFGVTDLAAMTWAVESTVLWQTMRYGDLSNYTSASPGTYVGRMRATGRASSSLLQVDGDFEDLAGQAAIGVLSGFFATPEGSGLELIQVSPDGSVIHATDVTEYVRLQLVQASPDSSVASIDVYVDGMLYLDDFEYKTATRFMDVPSGYHDIDVAPATSSSVDDRVKHLRPFLTAGDRSHGVFAGVLDPEAYLPNPDGLDTELNLFIFPGALEASDQSGHIAIRQFYGVPNLPGVSFTSEGILVGDDIRFGDFTSYAHPEPRTYVGGFRTTGLTSNVLYSEVRDFNELPMDAGLGVFTGIFGTDSGIEGFMVLPDGSVSPGDVRTPTMRAQIVHASVDPALETADFYFDGIPLLIDQPASGGTAFMTLPSGIHEIAVASGESTSKDEALAVYRLTYQQSNTYDIVLAGVLEPTDFAANPDGRDTGLNLFVTDDAREAPIDATDFSVRQFYGVINMPKSNFWVVEWGRTNWQDLSYGDFTDFDSSSEDYGTLHGEVREVGSSRLLQPLIAADKDWSEEFGNAVLEVITGYLYDEHPGGATADVRWFHVRPDGSVSHEEITGLWTSIEEESVIPTSFALVGNYPNPFNPSTEIVFDLPQSAEVTVEVYDLTGRRILTTDPASMPAGQGNSVRIEATAWSSGVYVYKVIARSGTSSWIGTGQMILLK